MPEATVLKMAEELLPRLRVAEWLDRAEAAQRQLEHLDLRDLRSVVAAANDPMVARDESTRTLAGELQDALAAKQEQELHLWFGDVDAALAVGRVIRALRLSSQPPKAGVPFPADIAQRLVDSTNAALAPMDGPDRWSAILEAAAFSPVRTLVRPARKPDAVSDELMTTVRRLAPALPLVAELFEIEVDPDAPMPKPQRPGPRQRKGKPDDQGRRRAAPPTSAEKPAEQRVAKTTEQPPAEEPPAEQPAAEQPPAEEPPAEQPPAEQPPAEQPAAEQPSAEQPPAEEPPAEQPPAEQPSAEQPPAEPTVSSGPAEAPSESTPAEAADQTAADTSSDDEESSS